MRARNHEKTKFQKKRNLKEIDEGSKDKSGVLNTAQGKVTDLFHYSIHSIECGCRNHTYEVSKRIPGDKAVNFGPKDKGC